MERKGHIAAAVDDIRKIERRDGVPRESLERIKQRLIRLARPGLFPESDFPPPADEKAWRVFPAHGDIREAR